MPPTETSHDLAKKGGIALILGGLLNILRAIPIAMSDGVTADNFPPHTVADIMLFSQFSVWRGSHMVALIAAILLIFGVTALTKAATTRGQVAPALMTQVALSFSMVLFMVAFTSDGLVLSFTVEKLQSLGPDVVASNHALIEYIHIVALSFAGVSAAVMLGSSVFLGIMLIRAFDAHLLGGFGVALGIVSILGYLTGFLSLNFTKTIQFVGPLAMLMFLYFAVIGVQMLRCRLGAAPAN
jgi:hypothetical protein